jgi:hypothetical protein
MREYEEYQLSQGALQYVLSTLDRGKTLSRLLARRLRVEPGRVVARLPAGIDPEALRGDFERGGILNVPECNVYSGRTPTGRDVTMTLIPTTDDDLVKLIVAYLEGGEDRICVFENRLARPTDPWLKRASSRFLSMGDEIYHIVCGPSASPSEVMGALRDGRATLSDVGVLSSHEGPLCDASRTSISSSELEDSATRAKAVLVGAFDGEAHLIWKHGS